MSEGVAMGMFTSMLILFISSAFIIEDGIFTRAAFLNIPFLYGPSLPYGSHDDMPFCQWDHDYFPDSHDRYRSRIQARVNSLPPTCRTGRLIASMSTPSSGTS